MAPVPFKRRYDVSKLANGLRALSTRLAAKAAGVVANGTVPAVVVGVMTNVTKMALGLAGLTTTRVTSTRGRGRFNAVVTAVTKGTSWNVEGDAPVTCNVTCADSAGTPG